MNPAAFASLLEATSPSAARQRQRQRRVLVIAPHRGLSFVEQDVELLSRGAEVEVLTREALRSRRRLLPAVARRFAARRHDLLFVWFADPYDTPALLRLARLFRVPSAVVVGGYEVAALPAIGYGALIERRARRRLRLALRLAGAVLPTSQLLAGEALALGAPPERLRVIPPGIDCEFWSPPSPERREPLVVTVATVSEGTWQVKGLDVFATCARLLPAARFAILGPCLDEALAGELRRRAGGNLEIPGARLAPAELRDWYRRATVYAQLSRRESFGVALAEAMACACSPVVSAAGALPALVGPAGRVVPAAKPRAAAEAVAAALADGAAPAARRRIQELFAAPRRAQALAEALAGLARPGGRARLAPARRTQPAEGADGANSAERGERGDRGEPGDRDVRAGHADRADRAD
jgi:glycosyltransferase involved in cell wall biosynthesis